MTPKNTKLDFTKLVKSLEDLGFSKFTAPDKRDNWHLPFLFSRHTEEGRQQIEGQRDKYKPDRFKIHLGMIPAKGIHAPHTGFIAAKDVTFVTWLPSYGVMYRSRFLKQLFRPEDLHNPDAIVREIDHFFRTGLCGKRTRFIRYYNEDDYKNPSP